MIKWDANFQIPNAATQAATVFVTAEGNIVKFYADKETQILLFEKEYAIPNGVDIDKYLLSLEDFQQYEMV